MCAGKVLFPEDQTGFLLLLPWMLCGEFKLLRYWKCVELNTLHSLGSYSFIGAKV